MILKPSPTQPGLLVNPDWQPGTPGTFAVIIGASRYRYLTGGDHPAPNTYSLGQLAVSALTALEWFRWLTSTYTFSEAPLAQCWLLLAPTAAELEYEPELSQYTCEPTFANCSQALGYWWQGLRDLSSSVATKSRALFFFSGHGIEILQDQQILLPSDYLCPPRSSWNDALSTGNLKRALATLAVPNQFFFLDACRNGSPELRSKVINGSSILNEDQSDAVNPALIAPLLYATSSGLQAFQQPEPKSGLSLFGSALLDGLSGKPDIPLVLQDQQYAVNLYALQKFVKNRVSDLLKAAGENVIQPVKMSGVVDETTVTYLKPFALRASRPDLSGFGREIAAVYSDDSALESLVISEEPTFQPVPAPWPAATVRLLSLTDKMPLSPGVFNFEYSANSSSYRLELHSGVLENNGYWLELNTPAAVWGCALPSTERDGSVRYLIEFQLSSIPGEAPQIANLEASLALSNSGGLGQAAQLWQEYRAADLTEALRRDIVYGKTDSPLAALVAAIVLLRANHPALQNAWLRANHPALQNAWLRNLAERFPNLPDARVLLAEQTVRDPSLISYAAQVAASLALLAAKPLPFTSEAFSYASRFAQSFSRPTSQAPAETIQSLAQLQSRLDRALPYLQPGGLFCTYSGFEPNTGLSLIGF